MVAEKKQQTSSANQSRSASESRNNQSNKPQTDTDKHRIEHLQASLAKVVNQTSATDEPKEKVTPPTPKTDSIPNLAPDTPPASVYKQSPDPAVGGTRQPAYVPYEQTNVPDLQTAKKILRHSGKERPPGT